jgi:hypothetical protein
VCNCCCSLSWNAVWLIWCVKLFQRNQSPLSSALFCHECGRSTSLQNICVYHVETHGIKSHKTISLFSSSCFIACNYLHLFFSVTQAGKYKGQGPPWPPVRIPGPCNPAYEDPRKLLRSRVFHAMVFVILYKAVNRRNVSEHLLALALYLLEMAVESAEALDHQSQVVFHFRCHSVLDEHGRYICAVSNSCLEVLVCMCIHMYTH